MLVCAVATGLAGLGAAAADDSQQTSQGPPVSALQIDQYLESKGSPMSGQGAAFVASGARWQVDPRLLVAIAGAESSFGQITCAPFNAWGWGCPNNPYDFASWADGIEAVTRGLRENYLSDGRVSVAAIHMKYAPIGAANDPTGLNNAWTVNVSRFLEELGGNPENVDLTGAPGRLYVGLLGNPVVDPAAYGAARPDHDGQIALVPGGAPVPYELSIENTGAVDWTPELVRLRRIDDATAVASAPYGALIDDRVQPGETGTFRIELAARTAGDHALRFRLEGLRGSFGESITVIATARAHTWMATPVRVLVASRVRRGSEPVELAIGEETAIVVTFRNDGTSSWWRESEGLLLLATAQGRAFGGVESQELAILQREVRPGEFGDFAVRIEPRQSGTGTLELELTAPGQAAGGFEGGSVELPVTVVV